MSDAAFVFVILPCMGAVLAGAVLFDWRLAAAALCGALGIALMIREFPVGAVFVFPVIIGVVLGALASLIALLRRPATDTWGRMIWALSLAFVVTFANLITTSFGA